MNEKTIVAAIIMCGLVGKYKLNEPDDQQIIAAMAAELTESLYRALKNEN